MKTDIGLGPIKLFEGSGLTQDGVSVGGSKPVVCESDGNFFSSATRACDFYGLKNAHMSTHLRVKRPKTMSNRVFRYATQKEIDKAILIHNDLSDR